MNTKKLLGIITVLSALGCLALFIGYNINLARQQKAQAVLVNGANALDMIGQYDEVSLTDPQPLYTKGNGNQDQPNRLGYILPSEAVMDTIHHRFFVVDAGDARVLVYNLNNDNTFPDRVPDNVLGQADFAHYDAPANTASGLNFPQGIAYDSAGDRLFVVENANRVKIFDTASITNGEDAVHILGQTNFTGAGSANTATGMNNPQRALFDSTSNRLFVSQTGNHRVTVYNIADGITDGEAAISVLGQTTFTASAAANTQIGMNSPKGLALDSATNRLFVSQTGNHRVTVYNLADGITDGEAAISVLGQTNFTAVSPGDTAIGMNVPQDLDFDPSTNRLFVSQSGNHRVTVYDVAAITDGEAAINVLGQTTFTASGAAATQTGFNSPFGLAYEPTSNRLYVVQDSGSRITVFDVAAITDGEPAVDALGQYSSAGTLADPQPSYTKFNAFNAPYYYGFNTTQGIFLDTVHHRLFVDDNGNGRVLVYDLNTNNALLDRIPDHVLGKPDFISDTFTNSQTLMTAPRAIAYDAANDRLFVATSQRVLVFDVASITDGEPAVNVLGQANFTANSAATTQAGVSSPAGLVYDAAHQRLFVSEAGNHRVTVFDVAAITDGEPAVNVLGQANFTSGGFSTTQSTLRSPIGLGYDTTRNLLFVSDAGNNRVMIFDVAAITDGEPAVNVLGQADFVTGTATTTQTSTRSPAGLAYDTVNQRLFVANSSAGRVTIFDLATITDGEAAVNILGSTSYTSAPGTVSQSTTANPTGLAYNTLNGQIWVGEGGGSRVTVFDASVPGFSVTQSSGTTAVTEGGATDSFDVVLTSQPASDVVLTVTSDDPSSATVSATSLTFTNGNWNTPQTITVTAPVDTNEISETPVITIAVDDATSDNAFDSVADQTVNVTVTDVPTVTASPTPTPPIFTGGGGGFSAPSSTPPPSTDPTTPTAPSAEDPAPVVDTQTPDHINVPTIEIPLHSAAPLIPETQENLEKLAQYCGFMEMDSTKEVTRGALVKILVECLQIAVPVPTAAPFGDVSMQNVFAPSLALAKSLGIIGGYADGTFRPLQPVTRAEAIKLILAARFKDADFSLTTTTFIDVPENVWFTKYVAYAFARGFVSGYLDAEGNSLHLFGPANPVHYAEAAKMLVNIFAW